MNNGDNFNIESTSKRTQQLQTIDLKYACLSEPIYKNDRKYLQFFWKGALDQWLGISSQSFHKIDEAHYCFYTTVMNIFYHTDNSLILLNVNVMQTF